MPILTRLRLPFFRVTAAGLILALITIVLLGNPSLGSSSRSSSLLPKLTINATLIKLTSNHYRLKLMVLIPEGFYLYSVKKSPPPAPIATSILYPDSWRILGDLQESPTKDFWDRVYERFTKVHQTQAEFIAQVNIPEKDAFKITPELFLRYQICSEKICSLPIKQKFKL